MHNLRFIRYTFKLLNIILKMSDYSQKRVHSVLYLSFFLLTITNFNNSVFIIKIYHLKFTSLWLCHVKKIWLLISKICWHIWITINLQEIVHVSTFIVGNNYKKISLVIFKSKVQRNARYFHFVMTWKLILIKILGVF